MDLPRWRDRWPGFVAVAEEQGFGTVHALPMRLRDQTVGTLNLFRAGIVPLSAQDLVLGQALADITTIAILHERALSRSDVVIGQLQGALNSRVIIEQAKGVLSIHGRISTDEAFTVLRGYARANNRRLAELARAVVADNEEARQVLSFAGTAP